MDINTSSTQLDRMLLEKEYGGYVPSSAPSALPNIPFQGVPTPSLPEIGEGGVGSNGKRRSLEDKIFSEREPDSGGKITGGSIPRSLSELTNPRYPIFVPGDYNNEDAYGQGQAWTSKMLNGIGKGLLTAGTTFLSNTAGTVYGGIKALNDGKTSSFYNNEFTRALDNFTKSMENKLPNYYTDAERAAHWYSPSKLLSANFIWDGIVKNMGFTAGAIAAGGVYSAGLRGLSTLIGKLPMIGKLLAVGRGAEALEATYAAANEAAATGRIAGSFGKLGSATDTFLGAFKVLDPAQKAIVTGFSTLGEASIEALNNMNQYRDKAIQDYKNSHFGEEPTGIDLDVINRGAEDVGNRSLWLNVAVLSVSNSVFLNKFLGSSFGADKKIVNNAIRETEELIVGEGGQMIAKQVPKLTKALRIARPYSFSISESFEEGSQYAITMGTQDFFKKKYSGERADIAESVIEGIKQVFGTDEGMENVLLGGLSGAMMKGPLADIMGKGPIAEARQKERTTAQAITDINKKKISDFTHESFDSLVRGAELMKEMEESAEDGREVDYNDAKANFAINYAIPRIKYGRADLIASDIEMMRQLASTNEGFRQLVKDGKTEENETREDFLEKLNDYESVTEDIKKAYESINIRYGGAVDENKKPKYDSTVLDRMVYATSKIADYDRRIPRLFPKLIAATVNVDEVLSDISKKSRVKYDDAVQKIENLDINKVSPEAKQELRETLDAVSDMTIRRNKLLNEYVKMVNDPKKFEEKPAPAPKDEEEEPPKPNTVKAGDRYFEIGKEYHLGRNVEQVDDNGKIVNFPSVVSIVGESEDKNDLLVKDKDGNIIPIPKTEIDSYNLLNPAERSLNPTVNFFMRNRDRKVKDKKGTEGTLEYNPKTGTLTFNYKNNEGKTKSSPVTLKDFKDKKFLFDTDLTAEDIADIEKFGKKFNIKDRINTVLGEHEKQGTPVMNNSQEYEPDAKKPTQLLIPSSANPNDGSEDTRRGNAFGFRLPFILQEITDKKRKGNVKGVYLTEKTEEELGLTGFIDQMLEKAKQQGKTFNPEEAIYLVAVDSSTGKYVPVDEFGEPITENIFDKIVFQPLFKELVWDNKWGKEETGEDKTPFRKYVTPEQRKTIEKNYTEYRDRILGTSSVIEHNIQASFGFPMLNKEIDEHGIERGKDKSVRTSVEDAGLTSQETMRTKPLILIPKTDDELPAGSTTFTKAKGKPFLILPNALVPLMNRKHTKEEASLIYKVIRQYAEYMEDANVRMDESKPKALIAWLKSVIYWGKPETQEGEAKKAAYNSIYWEVDVDGTFVLQIPQQKYKIEFSVESLESNKDELISKLSNMYLNIHSKKVEEISKGYNEITDINENGETKIRAWKNYQSFLLSNDYIPLDPAKKAEPRGDKTRLNAVILPVTKDRPVNREGIYWYVTDSEAEFNVGETQKPKKQTVPVTYKDVISLSQEEIDKVEGGFKRGSEKPYTVFITIGGEKFNFLFGVTPEDQVAFAPDEDITNAINAEIEKKEGKKPSEDAAENMLKDFIRSLIPAKTEEVAPEEKTIPILTLSFISSKDLVYKKSKDNNPSEVSKNKQKEIRDGLKELNELLKCI